MLWRSVTCPIRLAAPRNLLSCIASALAALLLSGCAVGRPVQATGGVHVLVATPMIGVAGTATLPAQGSLIFMPIIRQGQPVEPTATATTGAVPRPTRTYAEGIRIVNAVCSESTSQNGVSLSLEGEIRNDSQQNVHALRVIAQAMGESGVCGRGALAPLGQAEAILGAGESWPFNGVISISCPAEQVQLELMGLVTGEAPLRLAVEGASVGVSSSGDWMLTGTLRNTTGAAVTYPRAIVTLNAPDGSYLASGLAYASVTSLAPAATTPFTVVIPAGRASGWHDFAIIATADRQ